MKRPCVANGDGIRKDRAISVHLKLVAEPDHDEQDRPTDPNGNGEGAQDIDVRTTGDYVPRRISNGGRPRYARCHVIASFGPPRPRPGQPPQGGKVPENRPPGNSNPTNSFRTRAGTKW